MPGTAFFYLRVSTNKQGEIGLDAQQKIAEDLWEKHLKTDYPRFEIFTDADVSARQHEFSKRPKGRELMMRVTPADCIIFPKFDRAFRNIRDALNMMHAWEEAGVRIFCPDFGLSAFGVPFYDSKNMMCRMGLIWLGFAAEFEAERVSQRMKDHVASAKARGRAYSRAAYGFKNVRRGEPSGAKNRPPAWVQPDDAEQIVARFIVTNRRDKGYAFTKIARHLNVNGYAARNGRKFNQDSVKEIFNDFLKVVLFEEKHAAVRRRALKEWEFVTPDGRICPVFDKEHLRTEYEAAREASQSQRLPGPGDEAAE